MIQATFQEVDAGQETRPFYNADDPNQPYYELVNGSRQDNCVVAVKAGIAATTGTQVTPSPDSGYVGLWVVTVNYGQTEINSGNISEYPGAPFISQTRYVYYAAIDRDGSNNYSGTVVPGISAYTNGMIIVCSIVTSNLGDSTLNLNGVGANYIKDLNGNALVVGDLKSGGMYTMIFNNGVWTAQLLSSSSFVTDWVTGDKKFTENNTGQPATFILHDDSFTIGNVGSGATYSQATCYNLWLFWYNKFNNSICPVSGGRTTAIADWNDGKTMGVPAYSGNILGVYGTGTGLTPRSFYSKTGAETHSLTGAENGGHIHGVSDPGHHHSYTEITQGVLEYQNGANPKAFQVPVSANTGSSGTGISIQNAGSGTAHNIMQPTTFIYMFHKL